MFVGSFAQAQVQWESDAHAVGALLAQVATLPGQQQPQAVVAASAPPAPPFQLSPIEQQFVDQILTMWENESAKIKTFDCRFERWEYNHVFGPTTQPGQPPKPLYKADGQLSYSKPDKGSFKVNEIRMYNPNFLTEGGEEYVLQKDKVGEHWVSDGKAIYEYIHEKKQLVVRPLPPDMQGKGIVNGPLPFLFGAEAQKIKQRYWIRSLQSNPAQIWLEAYPRTQEDAANYHHVDIMLDRKTMRPMALRVHLPNNKESDMYTFHEPTINGTLNKLFGKLFSSPSTPIGWDRIVEQLPAQPQQAEIPQAGAPRDAQMR
jgi:TIGR03009 family protein